MDDRSGLAIRADVLSKLADQLSEQLAVERRANDELRALLRDGAFAPPPPQPVSPLGPLVAGVALVVTVCAAVAISWLRPPIPHACPSRITAASAAVTPVVPLTALIPAASPAPPPAPTVLEPERAAEMYPNGPVRSMPLWGDAVGCGTVVDAASARCFVEATRGLVAGERMTRTLFLSYALLSDTTRERIVADRYLSDYPDSPFAPAIRRLAAGD